MEAEKVIENDQECPANRSVSILFKDDPPRRPTIANKGARGGEQQEEEDADDELDPSGRPGILSSSFQYFTLVYSRLSWAR